MITYWIGECLLKCQSSKINKYVVPQKVQQFDDVIFGVFVVGIGACGSLLRKIFHDLGV